MEPKRVRRFYDLAAPLTAALTFSCNRASRHDHLPQPVRAAATPPVETAATTAPLRSDDATDSATWPSRKWSRPTTFHLSPRQVADRRPTLGVLKCLTTGLHLPVGQPDDLDLLDTPPGGSHRRRRPAQVARFIRRTAPEGRRIVLLQVRRRGLCRDLPPLQRRRVSLRPRNGTDRHTSQPPRSATTRSILSASHATGSSCAARTRTISRHSPRSPAQDSAARSAASRTSR